MELNLKDKVVLVTGGGHGLGKAISLSFANEGAKVAVNYNRNARKAEDTVKEIKDIYGTEAVAVCGDVTKEDDVKHIFKFVLECFKGIDILVNNAGICPVTMVKDMTYQEWENVIRTNLSSMFLTCREMINILIERKCAGKIVNVASQAAFNGSKRGKTHYSASKGGVVSFTTSLAKEVAEYGINVNAVAPGMIYTEMTAQTLDAEIEKYNKQIPLGRIATSEEVARVVNFLASDAASYITGSTVDVSGGMIGR